MTEPDIRIRVGPGHPFDNALDVRLTPGFQDDLKEIAEAAGVAASDVLEFSAGSDLAIVALSMGPGLVPAITDVMKTFLGRYKDASVEFNDGPVRKASGYSPKDIRRIVKDADQLRVEKDRQWQEARRLPEGSTPSRGEESSREP